MCAGPIVDNVISKLSENTASSRTHRCNFLLGVAGLGKTTITRALLKHHVEKVYCHMYWGRRSRRWTKEAVFCCWRHLAGKDVAVRDDVKVWTVAENRGSRWR